MAFMRHLAWCTEHNDADAIGAIRSRLCRHTRHFAASDLREAWPTGRHSEDAIDRGCGVYRCVALT